MSRRPRLALVLDPRFGGGTSSAVAQEILALAPVCELTIAFVESDMFRGGKSVNPKIAEALDRTGTATEWNPSRVSAETIVLHNPSFLKFNRGFGPRLNCARVVLVTHENFTRPDGTEAFDVAHVLRMIAARLPPCERIVSPVSHYNRRTVEAWFSSFGATLPGWQMAPIDWFNICELPLVPPIETPRDRRGRISRAGFEKFPEMSTMLAHFPPHAEHCAILGADSFLLSGGEMPEHWHLLPFGATDVDGFLRSIDFFVYFTNPNWRESFGRVLVEAIAAGKVVITDPGTAEIFGSAVVTSDGHNVDQIIEGFIAAPERYRMFVESAQQQLSRFSADAFRETVCRFLRDKSMIGELA
jgi:hypothetical protein